MTTEGLNAVAGCDSPGRAADVVFVHGLDGDAISTWQADDDPHYFWPAWLGKRFPAVGVWSLGYAVESSEWTGHSMPLTDRAKWMLDKLELKKLGQRPLLFICHSLGGLLVKEALRTASGSKRAEWRAIVGNTRAILFLSTPHSGANLANWLNYLQSFIRTTISVDELQAHHPRLRELNEWYRDNAPDRGITTFVYCEKLPTRGVLVVDETTADPGIAGVRPIPLDEDHRSICKPRSPNATVFERACRLLETYVLQTPPSTDPTDPAKLSELLLRLWADVNGSWIRVRHVAPPDGETSYFSIAFNNLPGSYPANATFRFWGAEPLNNAPGVSGPLAHTGCDLEVRLGDAGQSPIKVSFRVIDRAGRQWSYAKGDTYLMETVSSDEWRRVKKLEFTKNHWRAFEADGAEHEPGGRPDFTSLRGLVVEVGGAANPARPSAGEGVLLLRGFRLCD